MADEENPITDALWRLGSAFVYATIAALICYVIVEAANDPVTIGGTACAICILVFVPLLVGLAAFVAEIPRRLPRIAILILVPFFVGAWVSVGVWVVLMMSDVWPG